MSQKPPTVLRRISIVQAYEMEGMGNTKDYLEERIDPKGQHARRHILVVAFVIRVSPQKLG